LNQQNIGLADISRRNGHGSDDDSYQLTSKLQPLRDGTKSLNLSRRESSEQSLKQLEKLESNSVYQEFQQMNQSNQQALPITAPLTDNRKLISHKTYQQAKNLRWGSEHPYFRYLHIENYS
jgi:hypothetical protein